MENDAMKTGPHAASEQDGAGQYLMSVTATFQLNGDPDLVERVIEKAVTDTLERSGLDDAFCDAGADGSFLSAEVTSIVKREDG